MTTIPDPGAEPLVAHDVVGDPDAPRVIAFLHGVLGSRNNWRSFAKKVVEERPRWRAVLVDLRNHGDSHGQHPPHTVEACARDLVRLERHVGRFDVVVGHSYGGKVALQLAALSGHELRAAWILDAPPGVRDLHDDALHAGAREEIARVISAVRAVPVPVESRKALVEDLRAKSLPEAICQWMTTNLKPVEGGFGWKFDLDAIPEMLTSFGRLDLWPYLEAHTGAPEIVFVRGGRSDRFTDDEQARVHRAVARGVVVDHVLPDAGHWLHTDDPGALLRLLLPALDRIDEAVRA
jgi:pimeloyl-ACP methyl ester carboxylesterase